jgi:hypothetical protein
MDLVRSYKIIHVRVRVGVGVGCGCCASTISVILCTIVTVATLATRIYHRLF